MARRHVRCVGISATYSRRDRAYLPVGERTSGPREIEGCDAGVLPASCLVTTSGPFGRELP